MRRTLRIPSSIRRRAPADPPTPRFSTTGAPTWCAGPRSARSTRSWCLRYPPWPHTVNMLAEERLCKRHPGAASMQLHGCARHCWLLCQSLRALKSYATLAGPARRTQSLGDAARTHMCELVWGSCMGTFVKKGGFGENTPRITLPLHYSTSISYYPPPRCDIIVAISAQRGRSRERGRLATRQHQQNVFDAFLLAALCFARLFCDRVRSQRFTVH